MRRRFLACAAAAMLVAAFAPTALATTTKIPFVSDEVVIAEPVPGEWTMSGDVLSVRDAVWVSATAGTAAIEGTDTLHLRPAE